MNLAADSKPHLDTMTDKEISDGMDLLIQRFAKAGWITGTNITTLESTRLHLTPTGKQRLAALQEIMEQFLAKASAREGHLALHEWALIGVLWSPILSELQPPSLTLGESKTLCAWMAARAFNL